MIRRSVAGIAVLFAASFFLPSARGDAAGNLQASCESLTRLQLSDVRILEAVTVTIPAADSGAKVAHCRVSGVIETEIQFTELLPEQWNGRLFAGGQGGFAGTVANAAETSVNSGYATVGTDTGHQNTQGSAGVDASWALGHEDRFVNYGHRAIHRTAEVAKAIVKARYGSAPQYSYFFGCSNGGRQALMEAQRYAGDFDGIVSCAPAYDFSNIAASFVRNMQTVFPNAAALGTPLVTAENLRLLDAKVLEACDAQDGVKDGVIDDPRGCRFDLSALPLCAANTARADCLTMAQRSAIQRIYTPTVSGTEMVYPGQPFGGEGQPNGWSAWITGVNQKLFEDSGGRMPSLQFAFATEGFKYIVFQRPDWDYSRYDLSTWRADTRRFASIVNADNADLSAFKARRGKLILAHGWADPALNPLSTISYYDRVMSNDPGAGDYVRLFMMPGVLHCGGGAGPDTVDWFRPIADWVERGRAPERLIARKFDRQGRVTNSRPLCPYPQRAVYDGRGDTMTETSYTCKTIG